MTTASILNTCYKQLETLVRQYRAAIDGIPDDDLNAWKPAAEQHGGGPMNTLSAMSVHVVAAARWRIEQQLFNVEYLRDRESEFSATASRAELDEQFETLLRNFRERIDSGQDVDIFSPPTSIREDHPTWSRYDWLESAITHTALHLGHAQIHRQLWEAERGIAP